MVAATQRMSAQDAMFLYLEKPHEPLHIATIGIFDGDIPFDAAFRRLDEVMHLIPRYRQRPLFPPLAAGHPVWVDDPTFSLSRHMRHFRLPPPGTMQQLLDMCCELNEPMLARDRPLWDLFHITGLEGGRTASLQRVHHCMIDGVSAVDLALATLDLTPEMRVIESPAEPWSPAPLPDPVTAWRDAVADQASRSLRALTDLQIGSLDGQGAFRRGLNLARAMQSAARAGLRVPHRLPWNHAVGSRRSLGVAEMRFLEIRGIKNALGGTVNDVVLAIVGGALGRYLRYHGERVDRESARIMCPVNVRRPGEAGALGNRVSMLLVDLPLGITDPIDRLRAIREHVSRIKDQDQSAGFEVLVRLAETAPAAFGAVAGRFTIPPGTINLVCTNVPGPNIPLYSCGKRMVATYGFLPLLSDLGIGIAVSSYDQSFVFSITADPEVVPDVTRMAAFVTEEFEQMRDAAGVQPSDLPPIAAVARRRRRPPAGLDPRVPRTRRPAAAATGL
jgi:WS/DGAT/MGAT family acyltransferase